MFVRIPGGRFTMGSTTAQGQDDERPAHAVELDPFECAIHPVTQAEYAAFLSATGHAAPREWPRGDGAPDLPVTGVSWLDAVAYCLWRQASGDPQRLPCEAEWERAARGGREGERYPWGDTIPEWLPDGGRGPLRDPWPVTFGEPNDFGLYGIGANVHEWCADWYSPTFYAESPLRNPCGPATGVRRVSRGGAWRHATTVSRCTQRSAIAPELRYSDYGFRVVRDP